MNAASEAKDAATRKAVRRQVTPHTRAELRAPPGVDACVRACVCVFFTLKRSFYIPISTPGKTQCSVLILHPREMYQKYVVKKNETEKVHDKTRRRSD